MDHRAISYSELEIQVKSNMGHSGGKLRQSICIATLLLLGACSQTLQQVVAQEPTADTACALDGMLLKDYPGPKAQIQYVEGKPDFYCDLMELFSGPDNP